MRTHKHHKVAKSRGGVDEWWNLEEKGAYDHAYDHAVDFVLFDNAPVFDCRHEAWPLLPSDLQHAVRLKLSQFAKELFADQVGEKNPMYGRRGAANPRYGRKHSPESRAKMSSALKNKPKSEEHIQKIVESLKARPPKSAETREKLSKSLKGRPKSEEHKQKLSEAAMGNQRWLGRKHSEETRRKMSEAAKNRKKNG
jgi:hypothetical protein